MNALPHRTRPGRASAFTLLEVIVAIGITGLVIVALNFFIFSMGEIWGRGSDKRIFDQHINGVTRYLEKEFKAAALQPASMPGTPAFEPQEIRPSGGMTETLVTYDLLQASRLTRFQDRTLPEVVCSLQVRDRKGLFLLYHSRLEKRFNDDPPRETLITPLVEAMSYQYYDEDLRRWTSEPALKKDATGTYLAPNRIVLKFAYKGMSREVVIGLPSAEEGLPH